MKINKSYCINLDSRPDRWEQALQEFADIGLSVERFPAITGENKHLAFNRSQYECLKAGLASGEETFAVFEDDIAFDGSWQQVESAMKDLPYGWDALHLGCNICTDWFKRPQRVSSKLVRLWDCWQTHSIIYSRKGAEYILSKFNPDGEGWYIYDEWLRQNVLPDGNVYLLDPMLCYQRPSFSNIWERETDYTGAHLQGNIILKLL